MILVGRACIEQNWFRLCRLVYKQTSQLQGVLSIPSFVSFLKSLDIQLIIELDLVLIAFLLYESGHLSEPDGSLAMLMGHCYLLCRLKVMEKLELKTLNTLNCESISHLQVDNKLNELSKQQKILFSELNDKQHREMMQVSLVILSCLLGFCLSFVCTYIFSYLLPM